MATIKRPTLAAKPPQITQTFSPDPVKVTSQLATYVLKLTHAGGGDLTITQIEIGLIVTAGAMFTAVDCSMSPAAGAYDPVSPGRPLVWTGSAKLTTAKPTFTLTIQGSFNGTITAPVQSGIDWVRVSHSATPSPTAGPKKTTTVQP